ncbi:MAG: hypothetical protein EP330_03755 [Deltaproteobacteria bacterium]|nr:MAG: hypothetical protein EP330_03755 [Deltaproteobacteria bacterium]
MHLLAPRAAALTLMLALTLTACGKKTAPSAGGDTSGGDTTAAAPAPSGPIDIVFDDEEWDEEETMSFLEETADCGDLYALEPAAMLGNLSDPQISCLEDKLNVTEVQTFKKRLSLLLIVDAWSSGESERMRWEALVRRHLDEFDRSDPDLCYKFARHLQKRGSEYGEEAVRWADVALENKTRWTGDTYVSRVYSLLKLKSMAAADVWQASEAAFSANPGDESLREARDTRRNEAKTMAREWLDYARESGKDPTRAFDLCVSAAGTEQYCS